MGLIHTVPSSTCVPEHVLVEKQVAITMQRWGLDLIPGGSGIARNGLLLTDDNL